jgi:16S rRNA (guanine527-N7)-methyltransferase
MGRGFVLASDGARIGALAKSLGGELAAETRDALGRYVELVARWNQKLDLTAATDADAQLDVLLADAFVLSRVDLVPHGARCVDIGAGAGAPALPVAILRKDVDVTLVEPLRKRVAFLRTAMGTLGLLDRTRALEQKVDTDEPNVQGMPFDVAWSRATFAPELWLTVGMRLAPRTLVLLATHAPPTAPAGVSLSSVVTYEVPRTHAQRSIAVYVRQ